jgi:hypothetical protein
MILDNKFKILVLSGIILILQSLYRSNNEYEFNKFKLLCKNYINSLDSAPPPENRGV